jgi:hypothetical protein
LHPLDVKLVPVFRESYAERGTGDAQLIERIFYTCEIVHVWRCHTVHEGVFYRCPQSYFLHQPAAPRGQVPPDGLRIRRGPGFRDELYAHLTSPTGPAARRWCLGTVGRRRGHTQIPRSAWRAAQDASSEELIDWQRLADRERATTDSPYEKTVLGASDRVPQDWTGRRRPVQKGPDSSD